MASALPAFPVGRACRKHGGLTPSVGPPSCVVTLGLPQPDRAKRAGRWRSQLHRYSRHAACTFTPFSVAFRSDRSRPLALLARLASDAVSSTVRAHAESRGTGFQPIGVEFVAPERPLVRHSAKEAVAKYVSPAYAAVAKVRHPREGGDPCVRHTRASGTESGADRICVRRGGCRADGAFARPTSTWIPTFAGMTFGVTEPPRASTNPPTPRE
jgi:hypothetical protein